MVDLGYELVSRPSEFVTALSILIKALHGRTGRGLIVQVPNSSIGRLQLDNFWIVNLGIGNHSHEKRTFVLQSFAVFGL